MRIVDRIRFRETGDPVPNGTEVQILAIDDDALIGTATTTDGYFEFEMNGYPGPVYYTATVGEHTFEHSSLSAGPAQGVQVGELQDALRAIGNGIVDDIANEMAVTPAASGIKVNVASGAVLGDGLLHRQYTSEEVTFSPHADSAGETNWYPLVVRFYSVSVDPEQKWRTELRAYTRPTLSLAESIALNTVGIDVEIARVRIAPGATSLTTDDIEMTTARAGEFELADITGIEDAIWEVVRDAIHADAPLTKEVDEDNQIVTLGATSDDVEIDDEQIRDIVAAFLTAGSNVTLTHDDEDDTLTIASTASGGGGGGAVYWDDENFGIPSPETVTGTRDIATATIANLPAGTWFVESQTHFSVYGNGSGIFNTKLTGNGTPQSPEQSSRNNDVRTGQWRQIILTGRRRLTLASATNVTATLRVAPVSGSAISMGAGVVFLKAIREA